MLFVVLCLEYLLATLRQLVELQCKKYLREIFYVVLLLGPDTGPVGLLTTLK